MWGEAAKRQWDLRFNREGCWQQLQNEEELNDENEKGNSIAGV